MRRVVIWIGLDLKIHSRCSNFSINKAVIGHVMGVNIVLYISADMRRTDKYPLYIGRYDRYRQISDIYHRY